LTNSLAFVGKNDFCNTPAHTTPYKHSLGTASGKFSIPVARPCNQLENVLEPTGIQPINTRR